MSIWALIIHNKALTIEMHFLFYYKAAELSKSKQGDLLYIVAAVDGVIYLLPAIGQLWEEGENRWGKRSQFTLRAEAGM